MSHSFMPLQTHWIGNEKKRQEELVPGTWQAIIPASFSESKPNNVNDINTVAPFLFIYRKN